MFAETSKLLSLENEKQKPLLFYSYFSRIVKIFVPAQNFTYTHAHTHILYKIIFKYIYILGEYEIKWRLIN